MGSVSLINGHIDGELTDNEIIKAWERCHAPDDCSRCPLIFEDCHKLILDLINRQKAEIERLENHIAEDGKKVEEQRAENEELRKKVNFLQASNNLNQSLLEKEKIEVELAKAETEIAKAEAVKEFAERLKTELTTGVGALRVSTFGVIDYLVKEMGVEGE